jgi:hypothetical protein
MPITPGIIKTVEWLNANGFITSDSGDGVTNVEAGMEGALDYPNVAIPVQPTGLVYLASALLILLKRVGVEVLPASEDTSIPCISASYDPADNSAIVMLYGVDDKMLEGKI